MDKCQFPMWPNVSVRTLKQLDFCGKNATNGPYCLEHHNICHNKAYIRDTAEERVLRADKSSLADEVKAKRIAKQEENTVKKKNGTHIKAELLPRIEVD